jgi:hypothetical protein
VKLTIPLFRINNPDPEFKDDKSKQMNTTSALLEPSIKGVKTTVRSLISVEFIVYSLSKMKTVNSSIPEYLPNAKVIVLQGDKTARQSLPYHHFHLSLQM